MSYQILPNLIFILAVLGIVVIFLRHFPEDEKLETEKTPKELTRANLRVKGLPVVNISKLKVYLKLIRKKLWDFILEAKDIKPESVARYNIKKIFQLKNKNTQAATPQTQPESTVTNEKVLLDKIKTEPKNLDSYAALGKFYLDEKKYNDAKDIFLYLINHDPTQGDYHAKLAFCYYHQKNFTEAVKYYESSLTLDSSQPNRYYNLGLCLDATGKTEEALKTIDKATNLEPKNIKYYLTSANFHIKLEQKTKAKEILTKAKKIDPKNTAVLEKLKQLTPPQKKI